MTLRHTLRKCADEVTLRLRGFARKLYRNFEVPLSLGLNLLPERIRLSIKMQTHLIHRLDCDWTDVYIHVDSLQEFSDRTQSCQKEPETISWMSESFTAGDVVFDVGANVGTYALLGARCASDICVYAFEPAFTNYVQLCRNVILNRMAAEVFPMMIPLTERTSLDWFNYANLESGGSLHAIGEAIDYKGESFEPLLKQPMTAFSLDDLIRQFSLPKPDHIKLDIDGLEFKVLRGASQTLRAVRSLMVEINRDEEEGTQIIQYLAERGLILRSKHRYAFAGDLGPFSNIYNCIFQRPEV